MSRLVPSASANCPRANGGAQCDRSRRHHDHHLRQGPRSGQAALQPAARVGGHRRPAVLRRLPRGGPGHRPGPERPQQGHDRPAPLLERRRRQRHASGAGRRRRHGGGRHQGQEGDGRPRSLRTAVLQRHDDRSRSLLLEMGDTIRPSQADLERLAPAPSSPRSSADSSNRRPTPSLSAWRSDGGRRTQPGPAPAPWDSEPSADAPPREPTAARPVGTTIG